MKKIVLLLMILIMCFTFAGCDNSAENTEETKTQHTVPPTDAMNTEPEWANVMCDLQLNSSDSQPVLLGKDFEMFALIGNTDADSYITIKVSDSANDIIKASQSAETMTFLINNFEVAKVTIDPKTFDGEFEFGHNDTFSQLCEFANIIRGLY